jgi:hypothetical protein
MANVQLVLQYEGHEARVSIPLRVDIPEILRRVRLKRSPNPLTEMAHQVTLEIQCAVEDQDIIRNLVHELAKGLEPK